MLRGIVTVGGWTMLSRILGFLRDMLLAALAGTGPVADAFFIALRLPNLFRRLFGEGAFNAAFVPEFSGILATDGPDEARRFAQEAIAVLAFWLLLVTLLGELFMPQLMALLAPGFEAVPGKAELTVTLARITFPYLFLICLAALLSGVLNGLDRFAAAAAAPLVFNGVSIAAMLVLTPYVPTVGHSLAWGVTVSGVLQLALLAWAVRRAGMALHVPRPRMTPRMQVLLRRMGPGLVGAGVTQLNLAVDVVIVSLLPPGSASLLYYADRVNQLPLGVIGTAVGTALLPLLSRQARTGDTAGAVATLNRALEISMVLTLPAALALGVAGGADHARAVRPRRIRRHQRAVEFAGARRICIRAAGLRGAEGPRPGVLRAWRHEHAGAGRHGRHRAQPVAEPAVHGAAGACRAGARDQRVGDLQRAGALGRAQPARTARGGRQAASPAAAHGLGGAGHGRRAMVRRAHSLRRDRRHRRPALAGAGSAGRFGGSPPTSWRRSFSARSIFGSCSTRCAVAGARSKPKDCYFS